MYDFSKREKSILIFGITFVILFFGFQFGVAPVFEKKETLKRILNEKQAALEEMVKLQQQFMAVSNNFDTKIQVLTNREKDFSLFSFLDSQAQKSGVKENVEYMKPFTKKLEKSLYTLATVKIQLKEVYLKELIDFLYHIETSKNGVTITSLSLTKTGKEKVKLDAVIETETLLLKGKA